jgi:outer membrane immunogenic protein
MRKEIATLRQNNAQATHHAAAPADAPGRSLRANESSAMASNASYIPAKSSSYGEAPRAFSWSGFYLGLHAGYGWGSNDWNLLGAVEGPGFFGSPLNPKTQGVLGGIQGGANYQLGNWVVGIEAELTYMHGKGTDNGTLLGVFPTTATSQIDWLATFTGRFGYAFGPSLLYAKGGVAAAEYKDSLSLINGVPAFVDFGTKTNTNVGWTVGAGWEYAFAPNWSAKIEYNYLDLGTTTEIFFATPGAGLSLQQEIQHTLQIAKVGVNYRF